jgi:hypothetical protein
MVRSFARPDGVAYLNRLFLDVRKSQAESGPQSRGFLGVRFVEVSTCAAIYIHLFVAGKVEDDRRIYDDGPYALLSCQF